MQELRSCMNEGPQAFGPLLDFASGGGVGIYPPHKIGSRDN